MNIVDVETSNELIQLISKAFKCNPTQIKDIEFLNKGMTNRSFIFTYNNKRYIIRTSGEGTENLINRKEEYDVYQEISSLKICEDIIYINPENGCKISEFLESARPCNAENMEDVKKCMQTLREFHQSKKHVKHTFDVFERIDFYESLWNNTPSCYKDYEVTKANIMSLKEYVNSIKKEYTLAHIDSVSDNFLFINNEIKLIDWEYAGQQDPHIDIAMFAIYALYDKNQIDNLIDYYFNKKCTFDIRIKIYAYIAICGLLWSNWCEYKRQKGVEFGEYALRQYRYAKDYYRIFTKEYEKVE